MQSVLVIRDSIVSNVKFVSIVIIVSVVCKKNTNNKNNNNKRKRKKKSKGQQSSSEHSRALITRVTESGIHHFATQAKKHRFQKNY